MDLVFPPEVARHSTFSDLWRSMHWTTSENLKHGKLWLAAVLALVIVVGVAHLIGPPGAWLGALWVIPGAVVAYLAFTFGTAVWLSNDPAFRAFTSPSGNTILGFRQIRDDALTLQHHVTRHFGTGEGRAFRERLAPVVVAFLRDNPSLRLQLRAQNDRVLEVYRPELESHFPAAEGWLISVVERTVTVLRPTS